MDWANISGDEFELAYLKPDTFKLLLALVYAVDSAFKNFRAVLLKTLDGRPDQSLADIRGLLQHENFALGIVRWTQFRILHSLA